MARILRPGPKRLWTASNQIKPIGIPRLNFSHPLTNGLAMYWIDIGGKTYIDLVSGRQTVKAPSAVDPAQTSTPYGNSCSFTPANSLQADQIVLPQQAWSAPYTFATGFYLTSALTGTPGIFGIADAAGNDIVMFFGNTGTTFGCSLANASTPYSFTYALNTLYVAVGAATGANTQSHWVNGLAQTAGTVTSAFTGTNEHVIFGSVNYAATNAGAANLNVFWGAAWSRALSEEEAKLLYNDPYCFLEPTEGEMPVLQVTGAVTSSAVASSDGVGAAAAIGASFAADAVSASGTGAAAAIGSTIAGSVGASAGIGAATATGTAVSSGVGASAGVGGSSVVGAATAASTGTSAGVGAASATGAVVSAAVASAAGTGAGVDLARSFNGTSDKIATGFVSGFTISTPFSLSIWANASASKSGGSLLSTFDDSISFDGIGFYWGGTLPGADHLFFILGVSSQLAQKYETSTMSTNTWYHLLVTYDGSQTLAGMKLYRNGNLATTADNAKNPNVGFTNRAFVVGGDAAGTSADYFPGRLADIAVWNTVLTPTQASNLAAGQRANTIGANANLVHYEPILGKSPEPDRSGLNSNNGILTGTTVVAGPPSLALFDSGAVGASTAASAGAAAGVGSASGIGSSTAASTAVAAGVGSAVGLADTGSAIASATGTGAALAVGRSVFAGVGATAGTGAATATGASFAAAIATSAGIGAASGVGRSTPAATAAAAGTGTAAAIGQLTTAAVGASAGVGAVVGISQAGTSVGSATGVGTAAAVGASTAASLAAASSSSLPFAVLAINLSGSVVNMPATNAGGLVGNITLTTSPPGGNTTVTLGGPDATKFALTNSGLTPCDLIVGPVNLPAGSYNISLSAGASVVLGVGTAVQSTVGNATGVGVGNGIAPAAATSGTASATGTGAATAVGISFFAGVGATAGTGAATAAGIKVTAAVAAATGSGAATGVGTGVLGSVGATAGTGAATGVGRGIAGATAVAAGVGNQIGLSSNAVGIGAATGTGAAAAVGRSFAAAAANSSGVGTANAFGAFIKAAVGNATGVGTASAVGTTVSQVVASAVGAAAGVGAASGAGATFTIYTFPIAKALDSDYGIRRSKLGRGRLIIGRR